MSVGDWGIQPSEFGAMNVDRWWKLFDYKLLQSERMKNPDHISRAEWDDAHRRHKEKMNDPVSCA